MVITFNLLFVSNTKIIVERMVNFPLHDLVKCREFRVAEALYEDEHRHCHHTDKQNSSAEKSLVTFPSFVCESHMKCKSTSLLVSGHNNI